MDYNLVNYKEKYLKYKQKYIELKNKLYGGNDIKNDDLVHIWYKNWPDQGVPQIDDFYKFIIYCNNDIKKREGGTVIHCSGGIGRTGTVYVILKIINMFDYDKSLKDKAKIGNKINKNYIASLIGKIVLEARHHRPQMVERVEQYLAIYQIVMKHLDNNFELKDINRGSFYDISGNYNNFFDKEENKILKQMTKEFCEMPEFALPPFYGSFQNVIGKRNDCDLVTTKPYQSNPKESITLSCTKKDICVKHNKNRYDDNPATTKYRIKFCEKPKSECYINADKMMPYFTMNGENIVIATQAPFSNETTNDFKKMIKMYNIKRIIMLTLLEEVVYDIKLEKDESLYKTRKFSHKIRSNDYFAEDTNLKKLKDESGNIIRDPKDTTGYFASTYEIDEISTDFNPRITKTPNIKERFVGNEVDTIDRIDRIDRDEKYNKFISVHTHELSKIFKIGIINKEIWFNFEHK